MPSLHCCAGFSLVAESRGSRVAVALGLLTVEASLVADKYFGAHDYAFLDGHTFLDVELLSHR